MGQGGERPQVSFSVNAENLYREESFTDISVASIKKLVPICIDGKDDETRPALFIGTTQLMTPQGPVPLQAYLKAETLEGAVAAFPETMKKAMDDMVEKVRQLQKQEQAKARDASRIIVPGRK